MAMHCARSRTTTWRPHALCVMNELCYIVPHQLLSQNTSKKNTPSTSPLDSASPQQARNTCVGNHGTRARRDRAGAEEAIVPPVAGCRRMGGPVGPSPTRSRRGTRRRPWGHHKAADGLLVLAKTERQRYHPALMTRALPGLHSKNPLFPRNRL